MGWTIPTKKASTPGGHNSVGNTNVASKLPRYDRYRASRGSYGDNRSTGNTSFESNGRGSYGDNRSTGNTSFEANGSTEKNLFSDAKKRKFLSNDELNEKVHTVAPKSSAANYMLPRIVSHEMVIIGQESAHALTLVTPEHFRSFIRLILRFLLCPKLLRKKTKIIRRLTDFVWRNSKFHKELLEPVHLVDFLNGIGITNNSLPRCHEKFGDQYAELLNRLAIVSLELVHRIPLTRHRKPGSSNFSWVSDLDSVDQGKVNNNLHLFNEITYKDRRKTTASMLSVQMSTEVLPQEKNKEVTETSVVSKKKGDNSVKVLGFNIDLKKTRHECWKDGMKEFCSNNHLEYFNELTLPPNYNSHVFLSSLHDKKIIALKDGLSLLTSEKAKRSGNTTKKDWIDDDPYRRSDSEVDSDEEDDDDDSVPSYCFSGITNTVLNGKDVCFFMENLVETNYMWDIGCQAQSFCIGHGLEQNKFCKSCYCPFGFHNEGWRSDCGLNELMSMNEVPKCKNHTFDSPHSLWQHCKSKASDCILHFTMQKYLEQLYAKVVTKNDYALKVSNMHLLTLSLFQVDR